MNLLSWKTNNKSCLTLFCVPRHNFFLCSTYCETDKLFILKWKSVDHYHFFHKIVVPKYIYSNSISNQILTLVPRIISSNEFFSEVLKVLKTSRYKLDHAFDLYHKFLHLND